MLGRVFASTVCVLPLLVTQVAAMPAASETASAFANLASLLPCQPDIEILAEDLGYRKVAQTQIDKDYADIEYSDVLNQTHLTVSFEGTPIGAQFSVLLDIPETDQVYADTVVTALRRDWSLPESVHLQNLASGTAQFWTVELPKGVAQITVRHDNMTTQISGTLEPQTRGIPLPC